MKRRPILAALAIAALAAAGCGNKEAVVKEAKTEGIYLDVGPLDYQVQLSRILNPSEDRDYFGGLPEGAAKLSSTETWFAVFIRVANATEKPHPMAKDFEIVDTLEQVYKPLAIDPASNSVAYAAHVLAPKTLVPPQDSVAADGPTQGSMLLFKLPYDTLQNRPLEFRIVDPDNPDDHAVVDLDV